MDDLIKAIIKKLYQRQQQTLCLSCLEFDSEKRTVRDFADHQHIKLKDIGAIQLSKLAKMDASDELTCWILKAIEFDCSVTIQLGFNALCLVPSELYEWPIVFKSKEGKMLHAVSNRVISYSDIALLNSQDILICFRHQRLTALAEEHLAKKKIQQIERI